MKQASVMKRDGAVLAPDLACINHHYLADESDTVRELIALARAKSTLSTAIDETALKLVEGVRSQRQKTSGLHAFLNHYDLSSQEGIILMCLAEALLRIPDVATVDKLINDKLSAANWEKHLGRSASFFVNASTWALMLTGKTLEKPIDGSKNTLKAFFNRVEAPVIRTALKSAMAIMAFEFVMGRSIDEALQRGRKEKNNLNRYSFDMLGEAALTLEDANRYQTAYAEAIRKIGESTDKNERLICRPGISIKLSALYPRYEYSQKQRACAELTCRLLTLARLAREAGISLTIDAEEAERLEMSLLIFEHVYRHSELNNWEGLGLAVQAYQKRALPVLQWLNALADDVGKIIPVRLVKGAYWDTEIKSAQEKGLRDFPVFTRKCNTDVSYLACVRYLLDECENIFPQFATHNAHTLAYIYHHADGKGYEFQRLHGMGEALYAQVTARDKLDIPCRVYAPVGSHASLLSYLVRRLLENGANTSFVNQIIHNEADARAIVSDPVEAVDELGSALRHPNIPLPSRLFGQERLNSTGINFADPDAVSCLLRQMDTACEDEWCASPVINGVPMSGILHEVINPSDGHSVGRISHVDEHGIREAIDVASAGFTDWNARPAGERAAILEKAAALYEQHQAQLAALCVREAGKCLIDTHTEIREAIDYLRYYALLARQHFDTPISLPGPTGESNTLRLQGRGLFVCISPWNFPLAIYTGQIAAALAAGNTVLAKPASQTTLIAHYATQLLYRAGVPAAALQFLPASGRLTGRAALADARIAGVALTGSTATAQTINQILAQRNAPIATLIAETGGQNVMIVDSTALAEQVVVDVVQSAFNSAGQRCSALRVLYLQDDIAEGVLNLLIGHMDELVIGDPLALSTDVGPVIDAAAKQALEAHIHSFEVSGKLLHRRPLPGHCNQGSYVAPVVLEIGSIKELEREHFGPVLHVARYAAKDLTKVMDDINACGYGLTLGIHSRIEQRAEEIRRRMRVGNVYVNRNMIGAVVGVQPFGGCGLSGTGPKAGGPHYLFRFATEQTCTVNTAAIGGNASLLAISAANPGGASI